MCPLSQLFHLICCRPRSYLSHWKAEAWIGEVLTVVVIKVSLSYLVLMWPVESQYSVESSVTSHLLHPHNKKWTHKTLNPRNSDQYSYVRKEKEEWKMFHKIFFYSDTEITSSHLTLTLENLFFTTKTLVCTST